MKKKNHGFGLLEILLSLFILSVIASITAPFVLREIQQVQLTKETSILVRMAEDIRGSFQSSDLENINVAAFSNIIPASVNPTLFATSTTPNYTTTLSNNWFTKLSRIRGIVPQLGVIPNTQSELANILFNQTGNPRLLIAAPQENGMQRFLILSLMAGDNQLTLPPYSNSSAWFNAVWEHDWTSRSQSAPALWSTLLSAEESAKWNSGQGGTNTHKLIVQRIILPKYRITVNNNHLTNNGWVIYNEGANQIMIPANSGVTVTEEILGGRLILGFKGSTLPANPSLRFNLIEDAVITIQ